MARKPESVSKRAKRLAEFRHLTDAEAEALLDDATSRTISAPVEWEVSQSRGGVPSEVRFTVPVHTSLGETLSIKGRIELDAVQASHWVLVWGDKTREEQPVAIRRLDLRDTHRNPDGQWWDRQTHKHLWSAADGNDWAYTPTDIPHDPSPDPDGPDDYGQVFEAFVAECKIELGPDYKWTDPPLHQQRADQPMWEVP